MNSKRSLGLLSVVAPVLDEGETLERFYERVTAALDGLEFELVLTDDGSTDSTPEILERLADADPRVRVIRLSRSFGYQAAVTAGLDHAAGDAIVTIDADLQDPPELIPELVERWREGSDIVYAVRRQRRGESRAKLFTARWFTRLFSSLAELDIPTDAGDFRLLDRRALDAVLAMRERARFLRGMTVWVGFTQSSVPYDRGPREAGESRYRWRTLLRISFDAITSFSRVPLQIATVVGFVVSAVAFLAIPYAIFARVLGVPYVKGFSTILLAVLFLGGVQLITLGIIGEYLGRVYDEVKSRPLYVVRERRNVPEPDVVAAPPTEVQSRQ
jgi:glycosyltransferase involved in cell wall biosynthesis